MPSFSSLVLGCAGFLSLAVSGTKPIARHQTYHVAPGEEVVVSLDGYDVDGDSLTATITSLPETGQLHQLSQVFSTHGYSPKAQVASIATVPAQVTGSLNRVVYKRPSIDAYPRDGKYAEFRYVVNDGSDPSNEGVVVVSYSDTTMSSSFATSSEGWTLSENGAQNQAVQYQQTSQGLLSYFIYGTDALVQTSNDGTDLKQWYFEAPAKFLGNHWDMYNGLLSFVLGGPVGDFSSNNLNHDGKSALVVLECGSCNRNKGIRLVLRLGDDLNFNGQTKKFSIRLNEQANWLKDSRSTIVPFSAPSQCEFVQVLSGLSSVKILGDFTKSYETIAIDSIEFKHGDGQPLACY